MRFKPFSTLKACICGWRYRPMLAAYLDDELAADTRRRVKTHLKGCAHCRGEFENMSFASQLAKNFSIEVNVPQALPQSLRNRINQKPSTNSQNQPGKRLIFVPTAALLLICFGVVALWFYTQQRDSSWQVARLDGAPRIGSNGIENIGSISVGQWLETDASSRARIDVADIGYLEVAANSRIGLLGTGSKEHRLSLERGRIHARIWAPPRLFFVETPSATAVDYGCEYTLEVDDSGNSLLNVTEGWVSLEFNGRKSLVPEGAFCETKRGIGPGTPYFAGASQNFRTALSKFDFEGGGASSVASIISEARFQDALTLWYLLTRAEAGERERIYERLSVLSAPPDAATREGILGLDERMLDTWREKIIVRSKNLPTAAGSLVTTAKMKLPRSGHTATLLPDDRVLIAGGMIREGKFLSEAEIYDANKETFEFTGTMSIKRVGHTATLLPNGKVLVAGGWTENQPTEGAEIYDPSNGRFFPTGSMKKPRVSHRATLLTDGKVLITGGQSSKSSKLANAEIYDPSTGEFSEIGNMTTPRMDHTATLLNNGKVLITGGGIGRYPSETVYSSAELYDPKSGAFSLTGDMTTVRFKHAAALLRDGKVLIIGGSDSKVWQGRYSSTEVYDPERGTFSVTGGMGAARFKNREAVITLTNGKVLVAGGGGWIEIYDPQTETFGTVAESSSVSGFHSSATLLGDGRVLLTGGIGGFSSENATNDAWIYNP